MKNYTTFIKHIFFLLLFSNLTFAGEPVKNILILHSYHKTQVWVTQIDKAINDVLKPEQNNFNIYTEYMDTKRFSSQGYIDDLKKLYKNKYKDTKFDIILSSDNNAFDFLRNYRNELFGDVPVSFCGVNDFKDSYLEKVKNFTGVIEDCDAKTTLELALKLFPKTKNVFIINDYLETGRAWRNTIESQIKGIKVNVIYSENYSLLELKTKLKELSDDDTIVLLGAYFKDKDNQNISWEDASKIIPQNTNSPVFALLRYHMGYGIIGGNLIDSYYQGQEMSKIAIKLLNGANVSDVAIKKEQTNQLLFDYNALLKFDIKENQLPLNSYFINKPLNYLEINKVNIALFLSAFFVLSVTILLLLMNIKKRKETEDLYNVVFENSPNGVLMLDMKTKNFIGCNSKALKMLGYLNKKYLYDKLPSEISPLYQPDGTFSSEKEQKMIAITIENGSHIFEWKHINLKEEEFWVEVTLTYVKINKKDLIHVGWKDIHDRKETEAKLKQLNENLEKEVANRTQKLNDFILSSTDFVWEINADGVYTYASEGINDLLGYSSDEVIGKSPFAFMTQEDAVKISEEFKQIIGAKSNIQHLVNWNIAKDGSRVCLVTNGIPFYDDNKNFLGYRGTDKNITDEMSKSLLIKEQKEEFETIFKYSKDGIAILDLESNFLNFNDAYLKMTGFTKEELLTKSCISLTSPEDRERSIAALSEVFKGGFVENFEKTCIVKNNRRMATNMSVCLLPDHKRILLVTKDVSALKLLESQAKLASMGEMIGNIAHQWRQPLSVISTIASGVAFKEVIGTLESKDIVPDMDNIVNQVTYLSNTIDDFRNFIKGDETIGFVNIKSLMDKTFSITEPSLKTHYIEFISDIDSSITIEGYENELIQALINIINNAKDALNMDENLENKYIFIEAKEVDNVCQIRIKDNGGGIKQEVISKIFEPYFTTKHQSQGTGLGLAMTYKIITQMHNGTIEVANENFSYKNHDYIGAVFTIKL